MTLQVYVRQFSKAEALRNAMVCKDFFSIGFSHKQKAYSKSNLSFLTLLATLSMFVFRNITTAEF